MRSAEIDSSAKPHGPPTAKVLSEFQFILLSASQFHQLTKIAGGRARASSLQARRVSRLKFPARSVAQLSKLRPLSDRAQIKPLLQPLKTARERSANVELLESAERLVSAHCVSAHASMHAASPALMPRVRM
eukprot:6184078-Pleurochrysis_carterae.AAC.3